MGAVSRDPVVGEQRRFPAGPTGRRVFSGEERGTGHRARSGSRGRMQRAVFAGRLPSPSWHDADGGTAANSPRSGVGGARPGRSIGFNPRDRGPIRFHQPRPVRKALSGYIRTISDGDAAADGIPLAELGSLISLAIAASSWVDTCQWMPSPTMKGKLRPNRRDFSEIGCRLQETRPWRRSRSATQTQPKIWES